jgi:hypothetical protein
VCGSERASRRRAGLLVMAAVLCLLCGSPSAFAAGCHVAERAVLKTTLSWDRDLASNHPVTQPRMETPPVLSHPPCQGEIPHLQSSSLVTSGAAVLERWLPDPPSLSESMLVRPRREHDQPPSFRIDRPPRPLVFGVTAEQELPA